VVQGEWVASWVLLVVVAVVLGGGAGSKRCSEVCWLCSGVLLVVAGCGEWKLLGVELERI
jgi:hypothetical protein